MMELLTNPQTWITLATLSALEIVLGIDNIVFISIVAAKLPAEQRSKAEKLGLIFALGTRLALLLVISWIMKLTAPLFAIFGHSLSGRDLILLGGGLFLLAKSTHEIYERLEVDTGETASARGRATMPFVIAQIMVLDIVFSLDSVITAVGMAQDVPVMMAAMIIAVLVMLSFASAVGRFVNQHPSMKILALAFLLLIGVLLVAEAFGQHVSKGTIYFAMAFSLGVELINMRVRKAHQKALHLNEKFHGPERTA